MISRALIRSSVLLRVISRQSRSALPLAQSASWRPATAPVAFTPQWRSPVRHFSAKSAADEIMEDLQELYATAKDEFEIAMEETEKKTVYAEDDRAAAKEELEKLQKAFQDAVGDGQSEIGKEITRRIGQRLRELESAVKNMEEMAMAD